MPITDTMVRNAKSREQPYKLSDSRGMYLQVGAQWLQALAAEVPVQRQRAEARPLHS